MILITYNTYNITNTLQSTTLNETKDWHRSPYITLLIIATTHEMFRKYEGLVTFNFSSVLTQKPKNLHNLAYLTSLPWCFSQRYSSNVKLLDFVNCSYGQSSFTRHSKTRIQEKKICIVHFQQQVLNRPNSSRVCKWENEAFSNWLRNETLSIPSARQFSITLFRMYMIHTCKHKKTIGHFRVAVNLIMKARLSAELFIWKLVLFAFKWKLIFIIKSMHLASFWQWGSKQLRNGLLMFCMSRHGGHVGVQEQ